MSRLIAALVCVLSATFALAQSFDRANPNFRLSFPRDHGSHPSFQTEWWYLTGHLFGQGAEIFESTPSYGFQLTFFRRALAASNAANRFDQYFFAHAGLSDINAAEFLKARRSARSGLGLANASEESLNISIADWSLLSQGQELRIKFSLDRSTSLELNGKMPAVVPQGIAGYSIKAECTDCASHYYSIPRILLSGSIERSGRRQEVHALAWLDHEFMSNALSSNQTGWDWFSVSIKDGPDLMLFRMRSKEKSDFWSGALIQDGVARQLEKDEFQVRELAKWRSVHSAAVYPSGWQIEVPKAHIDLTLTALLQDQEQREEKPASPVYWEGAVQDLKNHALGYVELTGYVGELGGKL